MTIWNRFSWFDVHVNDKNTFHFGVISLLFALFRIWLSRFFAFICVISHLTFALFGLYWRYNAFQFRVISSLFAFYAFHSRYYAFGIMYFSWSDTNRLSYFSFRFFTFFSFRFFFFCFISFLTVSFSLFFSFRFLRFFRYFSHCFLFGFFLFVFFFRFFLRFSVYRYPINTSQNWLKVSWCNIDHQNGLVNRFTNQYPHSWGGRRREMRGKRRESGEKWGEKWEGGETREILRAQSAHRSEKGGGRQGMRGEGKGLEGERLTHCPPLYFKLYNTKRIK